MLLTGTHDKKVLMGPLTSMRSQAIHENKVSHKVVMSSHSCFILLLTKHVIHKTLR